MRVRYRGHKRVFTPAPIAAKVDVENDYPYLDPNSADHSGLDPACDHDFSEPPIRLGGSARTPDSCEFRCSRCGGTMWLFNNKISLAVRLRKGEAR